MQAKAHTSGGAPLLRSKTELPNAPRLPREDTVRSTREASTVKESSVFPLPDYLTMLIRTFMTSISREYISTPYWRNTVVVETGASSPLEFSMSPSQKQDLFQRGYDTTREVIPFKLEASTETAVAAQQARPAIAAE